MKNRKLKIAIIVTVGLGILVNTSQAIFKSITKSAVVNQADSATANSVANVMANPSATDGTNSDKQPTTPHMP